MNRRLLANQFREPSSCPPACNRKVETCQSSINQFRFLFPSHALFQQSVQFAAIPITEAETLTQRRAEERPNTWSDRSTTSQFARSKSMEFLPRQKTISTSALRGFFESKGATQPANSVNKPKNTDKPQGTAVMENAALNHKSTEGLLVFTETEDVNDVQKSAEPLKKKEENVTAKVLRMKDQPNAKNVKNYVCLSRKFPFFFLPPKGGKSFPVRKKKNLYRIK